MNVTAPTYENAKLVLITDKEGYVRSEPVRFTIYLENSGDDPQRIYLNEMMIHIRDANGKNILWFSTALSPIAGGFDGVPSVFVDPHSNYTFENIALENRGTSFWDWDQRNLTPEGVFVPVESGKYLVYATFESPPMRSNSVTIIIE